MTKDNLYKETHTPLKPFEFDAKVARVFDDMVHRSIPYYAEIQNLTAEICKYFYQFKGNLYDVGCSTGTTLLQLAHTFHESNEQAKLVGIDPSAAMIEEASQKISRFQYTSQISLSCDSLENFEFIQAEGIIAHFVMQFIPPQNRPSMWKKIFSALKSGPGASSSFFLFSEKIAHPNESIQNLLNQLHFDYKRKNGYSELEISQKREALEKVLIPQSAESITQELKNAGFQSVEILFKWGPFASFLALP